MKCPECGSEKTEKTSNSLRTITLTIPEHHFPLMRTAFIEMSNRMGMLGFGELANELTPYARNFDQDIQHLRYFDDKAVSLAFLGLSWGLKGRVTFGKEQPPIGVSPEPRLSVWVEFEDDKGKRKLMVAENAIKSSADWFKNYFEDAAQRIMPI